MKIKVCHFAEDNDQDDDNMIEYEGTVDFELTDDNLHKLGRVVDRWESIIGCIDQGGDDDYHELDCVEASFQGLEDVEKELRCFLRDLERAVK